MNESSRQYKEPLTVLLRCKTPLWTGNVDASNNPIYIKETGLIGSLRWWTEAVLRSLGYFVCDPTNSDSRKSGTSKVSRCPKVIEDDSYYCAACHIFGATGWRRRFRIESDAINMTRQTFIHVKPEGRTRGWRIYSGISNDLSLRITPLHSDFDPSLLKLPLAVAVLWGSIGAKTRLGYGVFEFNEEPVELLDLVEELKSYLDDKKLRPWPDQFAYPYSNLKDMFFCKIQFVADQDELVKLLRASVVNGDKIDSFIKGPIPLTPIIKNWLRYGCGRSLWKPESNDLKSNDIDKWLFGTASRDDRQAGKINISWAYQIEKGKWEIRAWGWLPNNTIGFNRSIFLKRLQDHLYSTKHKVLGFIEPSKIVRVEWKDCSPEESGIEYLRGLLSK